eukprot:Hpha_TRINITY_DN11533_c0_g1::TRINITY_DN11533_c0_g1_i1::g.32149::m.32149
MSSFGFSFSETISSEFGSSLHWRGTSGNRRYGEIRSASERISPLVASRTFNPPPSTPPPAALEGGRSRRSSRAERQGGYRAVKEKPQPHRLSIDDLVPKGRQPRHSMEDLLLHLADVERRRDEEFREEMRERKVREEERQRNRALELYTAAPRRRRSVSPPESTRSLPPSPPPEPEPGPGRREEKRAVGPPPVIMGDAVLRRLDNMKRGAEEVAQLRARLKSSCVELRAERASVRSSVASVPPSASIALSSADIPISPSMPVAAQASPQAVPAPHPAASAELEELRGEVAALRRQLAQSEDEWRGEVRRREEAVQDAECRLAAARRDAAAAAAGRQETEQSLAHEARDALRQCAELTERLRVAEAVRDAADADIVQWRNRAAAGSRLPPDPDDGAVLALLRGQVAEWKQRASDSAAAAERAAGQLEGFRSQSAAAADRLKTELEAERAKAGAAGKELRAARDTAIAEASKYRQRAEASEREAASERKKSEQFVARSAAAEAAKESEAEAARQAAERQVQGALSLQRCEEAAAAAAARTAEECERINAELTATRARLQVAEAQVAESRESIQAASGRERDMRSRLENARREAEQALASATALKAELGTSQRKERELGERIADEAATLRKERVAHEQALSDARAEARAAGARAESARREATEGRERLARTLEESGLEIEAAAARTRDERRRREETERKMQLQETELQSARARYDAEVKSLRSLLESRGGEEQRVEKDEAKWQKSLQELRATLADRERRLRRSEDCAELASAEYRARSGIVRDDFLVRAGAAAVLAAGVAGTAGRASRAERRAISERGFQTAEAERARVELRTLRDEREVLERDLRRVEEERQVLQKDLSLDREQHSRAQQDFGKELELSNAALRQRDATISDLRKELNADDRAAREQKLETEREIDSLKAQVRRLAGAEEESAELRQKIRELRARLDGEDPEQSVQGVAVGDTVRVRDSEAEPWQVGLVTDVTDGPRVALDGGRRSFRWRFIQRLRRAQAESSKEGPGLGQRVRVRDSDTEAWRLGVVSELTKDGHALVLVEGASRPFQWSIIEPLDSGAKDKDLLPPPPEAPPQPPAAAGLPGPSFVLGESVQVRDSTQDEWKGGTVVQIPTPSTNGQVVVALQGQEQGFVWKFIRRDSEELLAEREELRRRLVAAECVPLAPGLPVRVRDGRENSLGVVLSLDGPLPLVQQPGGPPRPLREGEWENAQGGDLAAHCAGLWGRLCELERAGAGGEGRTARIGDVVRVRDKGSRDWNTGRVSDMRSSGRPLVTVFGHRSALEWDEIEFEKTGEVWELEQLVDGLRQELVDA